eukprot:5235156-Ditylum_brightwellii.AAC.1
MQTQLQTQTITRSSQDTNHPAQTHSTPNLSLPPPEILTTSNQHPSKHTHPIHNTLTKYPTQ